VRGDQFADQRLRFIGDAEQRVREDYLRAKLETDAQGRLLARPFARQDSSMLRLLSDADCLVIRPPLALPLAAGEPVPFLRLAL